MDSIFLKISKLYEIEYKDDEPFTVNEQDLEGDNLLKKNIKE